MKIDVLIRLISGMKSGRSLKWKYARGLDLRCVKRMASFWEELLSNV